jgi:hypothetical protein
MDRGWGIVDTGGGLDDGHVLMASLDAILNVYKWSARCFTSC